MDLPGTSGERPISRHIVGASIPRSGHHLLARLLDAALGPRFFYCEAYGAAGCCRALPCDFRGRCELSFQKSHDFDLALPTDLADVTYVVQHRAPVWAALSWREYFAREEHDEAYADAIAADLRDYEVWLGRAAAYIVGFYERWLAPGPPNAVAIGYDDLVAAPGRVLGDLLGRLDIAVEPSAIDAAVARATGRAGHHGERAYVPRSLETSRYFDAGLLARFESLVFAHAKDLGYRRMLPAVSADGSAMERVFAARRAWQRGDARGALAAADEAASFAPATGLLRYEQAVYLQALGDHARAHQILREAVVLPPPNPILLDALVSLSLAIDDRPTARSAAGALVRLVGGDRAGPLALALADDVGPRQGQSAAPTEPGSDEALRDRIRGLEHEVLAREEALRRTERDLRARELATAAIADAARERGELIDNLTARIAEIESDLALMHGVADERLRLIERLTDELEVRRQDGEALEATARERGELIDRLEATARERGELIEELSAGLAEANRGVADLHRVADERLRLTERLTQDLSAIRVAARELEEAARERGDLIDVLTTRVGEASTRADALQAVAEERLELVQRLSAEVDELRSVRQELERTAGERGHLVDQLAATARERGELIERLTGRIAELDGTVDRLGRVAQERLGLIEALTSAQQEKDRQIARLTRHS